jgi:hypothetical protein
MSHPHSLCRKLLFLCDLFNINEYIHFIKGIKGIEKVKSRDAIINSLELYWRLRLGGTSGASEIFLMQMPGMV